MIKNYLIPFIALILIVLTLLAISGKDSFRLDGPGISSQIGEHEHIITPDQLKLLENQGNVMLLDLRNKEDFLNNHLPGAVNIPLKELSTKSIHEIFASTSTYVLYSGISPLACQAWILITQMGIENVLVLEIGPSTLRTDEIPAYTFRPDTVLFN